MAEQTEEKVEAVKNCAGCKKSISRAKRYYRNGAYYCNKNCYKKMLAGSVEEAQEGGDEGKGGGESKSEDKKEKKAEKKEEVKAEKKDEAKAEKKEKAQAESKSEG